MRLESSEKFSTVEECMMDLGVGDYECYEVRSCKISLRLDFVNFIVFVEFIDYGKEFDFYFDNNGELEFLLLFIGEGINWV